jgi:LysR family glycine cleavage system transcriptional activator
MGIWGFGHFQPFLSGVLVKQVLPPNRIVATQKKCRVLGKFTDEGAMDWSDLPTLNSMRAFSALAEHKSFSQAGSILNVTHAAVSQQVKSLELHLGVLLVERTGRRIRLTKEGKELARHLEVGFGAIRQGVTVLSDVSEQRPVHITMSPAFGSKWLMPRLPDFKSRHPEITLQLIPTSEVLLLGPGTADMAIRYRPADRVTGDVETIMLADMVVLGTPKLIGNHPVATPDDLTRLPWLQELGTTEVADWMRRCGNIESPSMQISNMPGYLIMDGVLRGDGLTYTARPFFETEIAEGKLSVLHSEPLHGHYYLEIRDGVIPKSAKLFAKWLRRVAQ